MEQRIKIGFIYLGILLSTFIFLPSLITTLFAFIDLNLINENDSWFRYNSIINGSLPFSISFLIASAISLLYLNRYVRKTDDQTTSSLKSFAIGAIIFISIAVIVISLAASIFTLLGGDLTTRFVIKVIILIIIFGITISYYKKSLSGYWYQNQKRGRDMGIAFGVVVFIIVVFGILLINPASINDRERTDDILNTLSRIVVDVDEVYKEIGILPDAGDFDRFREERIEKFAIEYTPNRVDGNYELCADLPYVLESRGLDGYPYERFEYSDTGRNCFTLSPR